MAVLSASLQSDRQIDAKHAAALERRLAGLPVIKHPARQVVLGAGSKTGRLFFLRNGAVEVIKDSAPCSVFGGQVFDYFIIGQSQWRS